MYYEDQIATIFGQGPAAPGPQGPPARQPQAPPSLGPLVK